MACDRGRMVRSKCRMSQRAGTCSAPASGERKEGPRDDNVPAGVAIQEFEVPGTPDSRTDTPLDLGAIVLKRSADIKAGDPAPAFSAKTLDGASISLNQYWGQVRGPALLG